MFWSGKFSKYYKKIYCIVIKCCLLWATVDAASFSSLCCADRQRPLLAAACQWKNSAQERPDVALFTKSSSFYSLLDVLLCSFSVETNTFTISSHTHTHTHTHTSLFALPGFSVFTTLLLKIYVIIGLDRFFGGSGLNWFDALEWKVNSWILPPSGSFRHRMYHSRLNHRFRLARF